jgi:hypothetical protein
MESMSQTEHPHVVAVVVDPAFGDRLLALAGRVHVWIIDTPANKAAAESVWREGGAAYSSERGVTTFSAYQTASPDEIVASMLDTIDLHHGEYSHVPPWSVLEVFGANPTPRLVAALAELGFSRVASILGGFKSWRTGEERDNLPM